MKPPRPRLSSHRLARLIAWARLWLSWCGSVLVYLIERHPERAERLTRVAALTVANLVFLSAVQTYTPVKYPRRHGRRAPRNCGLRRLRGARLRRPYATRGAVARFFATLALMRDFSAEVRRLRKRLATGLMRWRSTRYAWTGDALARSPLHAVASANTS